MTIKQLTEIVNGSLTPSNQKLDADLIEISSTAGNALQVSEDGILVDVSQLATKAELADAIAGVGGVTPQSDWTLTNATLVDGTLTYTGGTFEDEGGTGTITGLFAKKDLKVGESVTIDYPLDMNAGILSFAVDEGVKVGSNSDTGALFSKDMDKVRLISGRDWPTPYTAEADLTYKATIERTAKDRVVLSFKDQYDNVRAIRDVYLQGSDLKRVWILSSLAAFSTTITSTQSDYATVSALDSKVDKEEGKALSSNDYTNEDKALLTNLKSYEVRGDIYSDVTVQKETVGNEVSFTVYAPRFEDKVRSQAPDSLGTTTVNSVPLYSLNEDGTYVLTNPDQWITLSDSNYVIPAYHISTVSPFYLKGIVDINIYDAGDDIELVIMHNVQSTITNYSFECNPTYFRCKNSNFPITFESSPDGSFITKTVLIPKATISEFQGNTLATALADPSFRFSFRFIGEEYKETAQAHQVGFQVRAEA